MPIKEIDLIRDWVGRYRRNPNFTRMLTFLGMDVLSKVSSFLLLPVYLRLMTQDEYGLYNYILTIVTSFSVILNFGLYVSQAKFYSDTHKSEKRKVVTFNIFILLTVLTALCLIPIYAFGWDYSLIRFLFKDDIGYSKFRWAMLLATVVTVYTVILSNYFVTAEKAGLFRRYNLFRLIVINGVVLLCLYYFKGEKIHVRLLYTYLCELLALVIFFFYYAREMMPRIDLGLMRGFLKLGTPVMFTAVWGMISNYCDKFFLEKYGTAKDLSYYYLAFAVANVIYLICMAVHNSWMPTFLKEKDMAVNIRKTKKLFYTLTGGLLILGVFLMIGLYVAIRIGVISNKYMPAIYVLPFLLVAQVVSGMVLLSSNYMVYFEKTYHTLILGLITCGVGVLAAWLMVPPWGVYGAVIGYLIVQVAHCVLSLVLIRYLLARHNAGKLRAII
jgi:O-antigen/teichoic acid export membrane protein